MKIICSKSELLRGVNTVLKAVPAKTTMPILECILIDTTNGEIKLTANDMELGIETKIKGDILDKGKIALDAKLFSEIVRKLPDNEVSIQTDDAFRALIKCEKAKFNIAGKSGDDFSYLPEIEKNQMVVLSQFSLKEIIRQTIFSIADNENNRLMTGELFEINGNEMKVVSLDGHRISIRKIELKKEYNHIKVVVPGKTLNEVSKILSGGIDDDVCMFFTGRHIVFEFDDTIVVSRLIEGEYFRIEQMLSSDYETKISINKKELQSCIERASLLVKEGDKKPIIMNIMEDSMELKINSFIGSMNEDIDIIKTGRDLMIGFNPKFILDALRVIDDENIDIYMINPKAPCFIRDEEQKYIYLILPVNFNPGV
ncbi:MAG: DNA polymerase III subunit beta [Frisingicoccus sp.]|uniref:DNA polymerase III subunit beta n=1 Tax=Frisingicoccus sp. TaxID=1918627 RepID=UPI002607C08E|nr:DNA polymerase III subunit beta [Frisingicoccus sp.]MDD6232062.1 DNA polymerase III subunit beta [Frisingicoccus sp.]